MVSVGATWTLAEAAAILEPAITQRQLRDIVYALNWKPVGMRHTGRAGRPAPEYPAAELMRLHNALKPWLP